MNNALPALDLRDIHSAPPPGFWPPAPGWWLLAVLLVAVLVPASVWLYRRYRLYRRRRRVLAELEQLEAPGAQQHSAEFITAVSTLLRRVALLRFERRRVASLSGAAWLRFLDDTGGGGEFSTGAGQVLADGSYVSRPQDIAADRLLELARRWIKKNLGAAHEH
ncbi:MAG: DUF4381 domain-containing protein [Thiogranum sp.]